MNATYRINGSEVDAATFNDAFGGLATMMGGFFAAAMLISLAVAIFQIITMWKIFVKAGVEGWKAIIPIYNVYVLFEICGLKGWYIFLLLIPIAGPIIFFVHTIMAYINLAKSFGKESIYALGLILLPIVFTAILAFGNSEYKKIEEA